MHMYEHLGTIYMLPAQLELRNCSLNPINSKVFTVDSTEMSSVLTVQVSLFYCPSSSRN